MKNCPYCKMKVGGTTQICPLCQSPLVGEDSEDYWPKSNKLKAMSLLVKVFLFLILSGCVVCVALDFVLMEESHRHWSVPVLVWVMVCLYMISHFVKTHKSVPKILLHVMIVSSILAFYTGWFCGNKGVAIDFIIPIFCCFTLIANFIFSFIKKGFAENAIVCILCNIVVGIVPYVALLIHRGNAPMAWKISLILSMITFIGLLIFQGKTVLTEMQKRLHI